MSDPNTVGIQAILAKLNVLENAVAELKEQNEQLIEQNEQLREAISDFGLQGSGFSTFRPEDD